MKKPRSGQKRRNDSGPKKKSPSSSAAGGFRDRSGKVHHFGAGGASRPASSRDSDAPQEAPSKHHRAKPSAKGKFGGGKPSHRPSKPRHGHSEEKRHFKKERRGGHERGRGDRSHLTQLKARVDKNHKGFGFLIFENRQFEDAFVPPREAESLFHGDRVEVTIDGEGNVHGIDVLEHRFREVVGRFSAHLGRGGPRREGWVVYERKSAREEIFVPEAPSKVQPNDWVRAELNFHDSGPYRVSAKITEVYGQELPASADIGMVAAEYNLVEEHSAEAEREARAMRLEVPGKDLEGRADLRKMPFITIDGETARDFDDAVFVEREKSGFVLWVAIADVSHYVADGTALDQEARSRGTSVYFPEKAFHMLPRALSENLCSLRPNEPRLAFVSKMYFDHQGLRTKTEVMEAVIESRRRATYNEIEAEWKENSTNREWEFAPHFELYLHLRRSRSERGSIDFDLPEAEVLVDSKTGEVQSIKRRGRLEAHRLIEEFMIAANEAVTDWMMEKSWPFVYRIHDEPAGDSLLKFQRLAATVGVHLAIDPSGRKMNSPKVMAEVVRRLEGHPAQAMLNMALLRSLKQAVYSAVHGTHYGLASPGYTHFTSPIRRYPDLVVHRLLRWALKVSKLKPQERDQLEQELVEICEHCSYRERLASDAERESIKLKQVRAMLKELGNEFDAEVVGMVDSGLFVQLADPYCEGLVHKDTMTDDFYEFNEDRMVFYGKRKKRTFKIGDKLKIRVLRADIDRRQVDFGLLS